MSDKPLNYKGYKCMYSYDAESNLYYGRLIDTNDMVDFQALNVNDVEKAFCDVVDAYIEFKKECGKYD